MYVFLSISINFVFALQSSIQFDVAKKEIGVVIIVSPFFHFKILPTKYKADEPLDTTVQNLDVNFVHKSLSKFST